jgi:hypothetical protein
MRRAGLGPAELARRLCVSRQLLWTWRKGEALIPDYRVPELMSALQAPEPTHGPDARASVPALDAVTIEPWR